MFPPQFSTFYSNVKSSVTSQAPRYVPLPSPTLLATLALSPAGSSRCDRDHDRDLPGGPDAATTGT